MMATLLAEILYPLPLLAFLQVCTVSVSGRLTQLIAVPWFYRSLLLDQPNNFGALLTASAGQTRLRVNCYASYHQHRSLFLDQLNSSQKPLFPPLLGIHFETNAAGDTGLLTSGLAMLVTVLKKFPRSDVTSTSLVVLCSER